MKRIFVFLVLISLLLGCVEGDIGKKIRKNPDEYLYPFNGFEYDSINVSVEGDRIYVVAKSSELDGEDVYLYINDNGTLILKSYCLEALPLGLKQKAIEIALSNEQILNNASGVVTVRRILPHTAAKFYQLKELFSVTWHGDKTVSALVDIEEERVVDVYIK